MKKLAMVALVLGACSSSGSGGGGGSGPVSMSTAMSQCEKTCARDIMCEETDDTQDACETDCIGNLSSPSYRNDAVVVVTNCQAALACGADDDACITKCTPTSSHTAYETACREKFTACGNDIGGSGPDDVCEVTPTGDGDTGILCVITPAIMDKFKTCFSMECAEVMNCFQEVAEANDVDF